MKWTTPRFDTAYRITITGLNGGKVADISAGHANPVLQLNMLLTKWNTNGTLYDIAAFSGGSTSDSYMQEASVDIVISDSDCEKIEAAIEKQQTRMEKNYGKDEENYSFTFEKIDLPKKVLTTKSAAAVVSELYTLLSGDYIAAGTENSGDDSDTVNTGYTNIGKLSVSKSKARIYLVNYSMNPEVLEEMNDDTRALADISSFKTYKLGSTTHWILDTDNSYLEKLQGLAGDIDTESTYENNECSILKAQNDELNAVELKFNIKDWTDVADMVEGYLK